MVGWQTRFVKWLVLIGHISYDYRNPSLVYGVDAIAACLLLILCFAPIGRALSWDRVREVHLAKRKDLDLLASPPPFVSRWAFACTRLIQIQMAVLFFFSAIDKLKGEDWWNGDAVWQVFVSNDYYNGFLLDLFANHFWLVNLATYATVLIEIAYPFLVWQRATRPYALVGAIFLHLQFALLMNLYYFSFVMILGHMSFLRRAWLTQLGQWWKRKIGPMEMIYDGTCGFCKRSMAWFLAFDGLKQVSIRDFRTNPSPVVSDEKMLKALYAGAAGRPRLAGLRGLSPRGAAGAGTVVAGSVLLRARYSAACSGILYTIGSRPTAAGCNWPAQPASFLVIGRISDGTATIATAPVYGSDRGRGAADPADGPARRESGGVARARRVQRQRADRRTRHGHVRAAPRSGGRRRHDPADAAFVVLARFSVEAVHRSRHHAARPQRPAQP